MMTNVWAGGALGQYMNHLVTYDDGKTHRCRSDFSPTLLRLWPPLSGLSPTCICTLTFMRGSPTPQIMEIPSPPAGGRRLHGCRRYDPKDGGGRATQDAKAESNAWSSCRGLGRGGKPVMLTPSPTLPRARGKELLVYFHINFHDVDSNTPDHGKVPSPPRGRGLG